MYHAVFFRDLPAAPDGGGLEQASRAGWPSASKAFDTEHDVLRQPGLDVVVAELLLGSSGVVAEGPTRSGWLTPRRSTAPG